MKLTNKTFNDAINGMRTAYLDWELSEEQAILWKRLLKLAISDELFPKIIFDWVTNKTEPPKNPAEIIQHGREMFSAGLDGADTSAEIIIDSARKAYYVTEDFLTFADGYENSFAAALGTPAQEAYIVDNIRKRSNNPKILILVYDECKGSVKDCFTGDAEHGVEFLRNQIKKSWKEKSVSTANIFLKSDKADFKRLTGGSYGELEA